MATPIQSRTIDAARISGNESFRKRLMGIPPKEPEMKSPVCNHCHRPNKARWITGNNEFDIYECCGHIIKQRRN